MSGRTLLRLSGMALLIGCIVHVVGAVLYIPFGSGPGFPQPPVTLSWLVGYLLLLPGLPGFYIRQAGSAGVTGLIGWLIFLWRSLLILGFSVSAGVHIPALAPSAMTPQASGMVVALAIYGLTVNLFSFLGALLLGIATLRARVFPSWIGWLLIAASSLTLVEFILGLEGFAGALLGSLTQLVFSIAIGWSGFLLLRGGTFSEPSREATPVVQS